MAPSPRYTKPWKEGIFVQGYLNWSALDSREWGSFRPTFGLIAVDRETFVRSPKPSLQWLGNTAKANALAREKSPVGV